MTTISKTETALLVILSEGPAHPYQIEKTIAERSMDYWTELSQSSIYKTLRQLEAKGCAASEVALNERNVGRKTYRITEAGLEALRATLLEFLSVPEKRVWRVDLATSHLGLLEPSQVGAALERYAAELRSSIEGYGRLEEYLVASACPGPALALARRPRALFRAELAWLEEFRAGCGLPSGAAAAEEGAS